MWFSRFCASLRLSRLCEDEDLCFLWTDDCRGVVAVLESWRRFCPAPLVGEEGVEAEDFIVEEGELAAVVRADSFFVSALRTLERISESLSGCARGGAAGGLYPLGAKLVSVRVGWR